ncbi:hypothetical protein CKAH01_18144 [Colletotrichum kahawae]|uniref:Uncharacterized protein n=1 Tax=Colletotrichum kahawae TaxID=34407 RepID=A0AAD9Y9J3_COLKA|nr:hypothetical protein CKAH01_18144 [Colletotrichum kahawae]
MQDIGSWIKQQKTTKARATQATASCPNGVPLYVPSFATRLAGGYFTLTGASSSLLVLPLPSSSSSSLLIFFFLPRHLLPSSSSCAAAFLRDLTKKGATMNIIGWVILFGSLFGLLAPLAFEDPPGDCLSRFPMQISTTMMLFAPLVTASQRITFSSAVALIYSASLVQGNPTGPRQYHLPRDTTEVDSVSTCTQAGYARAIAEAIQRAEYAVKGLQSRNEDTMAAFDDPNAIKSAALVSDQYFHFRLKYVTYLQAEYNELRSSNMSLSQQVVDLTTSLQTSYDYGGTLGKN